MKRAVLASLILLVSITSDGQHNRIREANYDLAARFSPKEINQMVGSIKIEPNWFETSDKFWYSWRSPEGTFYYVVDPVAGEKYPLFDNGKLAAQLTAIIKEPFDAQNLPIINLRVVDERTFAFQVRSERNATRTPQGKVYGFEYDWKTQSLREIPRYQAYRTFPKWANVSPDHKYVVFSRNFNLYYMDWENFLKARRRPNDPSIVEHQLTFDGDERFLIGLGSRDPEASETSRMRRMRANILWSPDSRRFATVSRNLREVKDYWVIDHMNEPRPKLITYPYQMAGEAESPSYHLLVFDIERGDRTEIKSAAFKDQILKLFQQPVAPRDEGNPIEYKVWVGDNRGPYVSRTSRDLKRVDLCVAHLRADSLLPIIKERLNTYVEIRPPVRVGRNNIVWWSERSGWGHLYLYDREGNMVKQLTSGPFHVESIDAVDPAKKRIYFTANGREKGENPYYKHYYRVDLDGENLTLLNRGNWDHTAIPSNNGEYFVNIYSRADYAPRVSLMNNNGESILELEETDLSKLFKEQYRYPEPFTVKAADGKTDLYGVLYKPFDFDSTKLYPVIHHLYPGPQREAVHFAWSKGMNRSTRLAQLGFIVVQVGHRGGTPVRSKWYHNYSYGNLLDFGLEDKKVVIERLAAKHSYIDITRVGVHGHSGGGTMSVAALLAYPEFFKVAVSAAGNHDHYIYNRGWCEKHHGILEEVSAEGDTTFTFTIPTNVERAEKLKGKLLLVTGDMDNRVHPASTFRLANALIKANKRFDMLILPGQKHGFTDMNEYFFWRMADYFSQHLLGYEKKEIDLFQPKKR